MKHIITILAILQLCMTTVHAQELRVKSFSLSQSDLSAQTNPRKDNNDVNCALVKVGFGQQGCLFEGGVMGSVENRTGEYWVYMPKGNRFLKIKHPDYTPIMITFADYGVEKLDGNRTYILKLKNIESANVSNKKQKLDVVYSPGNATVLIDNEVVDGENGRLSIEIPVGKHEYIITAKGYDSENGTINIKASSPSRLNIELTRKDAPIASASTESKTSTNVKKLAGASKEVQEFYEKALNGDGDSMYKLVKAYYYGDGIAQNYSEAIKWAKKGVDLNYASCQNLIGVAYGEGNGVTKSVTEKVKYIKLAANQGNAKAQCNLGGCYDQGVGVAQSYSEAVKWWKLAANQGFATAQYNLGCCYAEGNVVTQSYSEAVK